jgi:CelD/BcsL family acetyltransferase involved in cellulose biosynthesis
VSAAGPVIVRRHEAYEVRRLPSLESIGPEDWDALRARAGGGTVFQSRSWNACWWESMRAVKTLLLLEVLRDGRRVALAPLHLDPDPTAGPGLAIRFLGQGNSDYLDAIVDRDEPEAAEAIVDALDALPEPWTTARLFELQASSALRSALARRVAAGDARLLQLPPTICPGFTPRGDETFDRLLRKSSFKRKAAGLAALGRVEIEHLEESRRIQQEIDAFFAQHIERWSVTPHPSPFVEAEVCTLYRRLAEGLAPENHVILTVVRLDERPVAYHFGLTDGDRFIWYKPSFDIRLFRESPGQVLLKGLLELCRDRGFRELDFTRGAEDFKFRYANHVDESANYLLYRTAFAATGARALQTARDLAGWATGGFSRTSVGRGLVGAFRVERREGRSRVVALTRVVADMVQHGISRVHAKAGSVLVFPDVPEDTTLAREADLGDLLDATGFPSDRVRSRFLQDAYERICRREICVAIFDGRALRGWLWLSFGDPSGALEITALNLSGERDVGMRRALVSGAQAVAKRSGRPLGARRMGPLSPREIAELVASGAAVRPLTPDRSTTYDPPDSTDHS